MDITKLLEESARNKLRIIEIFHSEYKGKIALDILVEKSGLSKFKIKGALGELTDDLDQLFQKKFFVFDKNEVTQAFTISNLDILNLKYSYIKESIAFRLFQFLLFSNKPIEEFAKEHFIGVTKLYSLRNVLNKLLVNDELKIKNNNIKGSEMTIRLIAFESYYYYFNGLDYPFAPEIQKEVKHFLIWLEHLFSMKMTNSEKDKLELFLSIIYLRIGGHNYLGNVPIDSENPEIIEIQQYIKRLFHLTHQDSLIEAQYIYLFLYVNEIIKPNELLNFTDNEKKIGHLTTIFIEELQRKVLNQPEQMSYLPLLQRRVSHIHERLFIFPQTSTTFIDEKQIQYFEENYRLFHLFIQRWLVENSGLLPEALNNFGKTKLYFDYMFELIDIVPLHLVEEPIYLAVDFSHGETYSKFIAKSIEAINALNTIIEWRLSPNTDIYVSDYYIKNLPCEQIIWRNPPDEYDWEEFIDKIILLRNGPEK